jgi:hypothetical protein
MGAPAAAAGGSQGHPVRPARLCAVLGLAVVLTCCARLRLPPSASPPSERPALAGLSDAQWLRDLDHLRRNINRVHENLMYSLAKHREFEDRVRRLRADLPALDVDERMVRVLRTVASLGDPHTRVSFRPTRRFPLEFFWFREGIFVTAAAPEYEHLVHAEVVGVEQAPLGPVISLLTEIIPHENESRLKDRLPGFLALGEILSGLRIIPSADKATFSFRDPDGRAFDAEVEARPWASGRPDRPRPASGETPLFLANRDMFYWFKYLEGSRTVFFQYNSCHDRPGLPFHRFSDALLEFVRRHEVDRVVVDLRHNSGGYSQLMRPFIRGIARVKKIDRPGGLVVIVGRRTFSAAVLNALELRREAGAILVGEPTGGKPSHYGDIRFFALPESRLTVSYPTQYIWQEGVLISSLEPDHTVEPSVRDWMAGRDPALEGILRGDFR